MIFARLTLLLFLIVTVGCSRREAPAPPPPSSTIREFPHFRVINSYPHDPTAFTQGLLAHEGRLYESTGLNGQSSLRMVDLHTGKIIKHHPLTPALFAEGLANWSNRLYQLTWKAGRCFVYDADTLDLITEHSYTGEGWGLTHNGQHLIMSDGTDTLRLLDPDTFSVIRRIRITREGTPQGFINELEWVNGQLLANIWQRDTIVVIDLETGTVMAEYDLTPLRTLLPMNTSAEVLNGISLHPTNHHLLVTGKWWPKLFEIELKQ